MIAAAGLVRRDATLADNGPAKDAAALPAVVDRAAIAPDNFAVENVRNVAVVVEKDFAEMNRANIARQNHCRTSW